MLSQLRHTFRCRLIAHAKVNTQQGLHLHPGKDAMRQLHIGFHSRGFRMRWTSSPFLLAFLALSLGGPIGTSFNIHVFSLTR